MTIQERSRATATKRNRARQHLAEVRIAEIVSVAAIETDYTDADRAGDLAMEDQFKRLYALADDEEERDAVARTYAVWMASERREGLAVRDSVGESVSLLKVNNPTFIDGAFTPSESDGVA